MEEGDDEFVPEAPQESLTAGYPLNDPSPCRPLLTPASVKKKPAIRGVIAATGLVRRVITNYVNLSDVGRGRKQREIRGKKHQKKCVQDKKKKTRRR